MSEERRSPSAIAHLFDDHKAPEAMRTIGEVSTALGIRQHVLRYWEEQFPLLRPVKRSGGRRYYRPADVELVRAIDRLVNHDGYTLRGARAAIAAATNQPSASETAREPSVTAAERDDMAAFLRALRQTLADALDRE